MGDDDSRVVREPCLGRSPSQPRRKRVLGLVIGDLGGGVNFSALGVARGRSATGNRRPTDVDQPFSSRAFSDLAHRPEGSHGHPF
ncbi:hypothetical protein J3R03_008708 [Actinoplanes couchii]|uniref:Uncharacterized protein n=1 Tax=Actinoplanes couchii TaxID=403638 RepID=A0ABQ3XJ12_9ACTN|nr:hypothetical protein [Actinoplanes couchii]GID58488.1 hypothetical protein Aco03nite_068920 [Actinoplanes couchii]